MSAQLNTPQPPRLPDPPPKVDSPYVVALLNALRLFFNQLHRVVALIAGVNGARFLQTPFGSFQSNLTQTASADTATFVGTNIVEAGNGVDLLVGHELVPVFSGVYSVDAALHFANSGVDEQISVWLRVNGSDITGSCEDVTVGANTFSNFSWLLQLTGGDKLEVFWSTPSTSVTLAPLPARATPTRPARQAVSIVVRLVSAAPNT